MKERLKLLRKSQNLTQCEFGKRIGMSDVAISYMESGRTALSEQNVKLICLTFRVREEWLRHGTGEMLEEEAQLSGDDQELLGLFHSLSPRARKLLIEYAAKLIADAQALREEVLSAEKWVNPIHSMKRA
jgi:transcriptional regulator with XRE-family HTH domain